MVRHSWLIGLAVQHERHTRVQWTAYVHGNHVVTADLHMERAIYQTLLPICRASPPVDRYLILFGVMKHMRVNNSPSPGVANK